MAITEQLLDQARVLVEAATPPIPDSDKALLRDDLRVYGLAISRVDKDGNMRRIAPADWREPAPE